MRKATFMSLTIVAITLLLIPVGALAQYLDEVECRSGGPDAPVAFYLQLDEILPSLDQTGYTFFYTVSEDVDSKITHGAVSQLCDTQNEIKNRLECGVGDPKTGWGVGDNNIGVMPFSATTIGSGGTPIEANAENRKLGFVSVGFTTAKKMYTCGEILGPGDTDTTASVTSSQTFTLPPISDGEAYCDLKITFDPLTAEIVLPDADDPSYAECLILKNNADLSDFVPIDQLDDGTVHVTDNTIEITSNSPTCYTYYYNGYAKQFCYGY